MNCIRDIYKKDYRGFETLPARRTGVKERYSVKSQRTILKDYLLEDFKKNVYIVAGIAIVMIQQVSILNI